MLPIKSLASLHPANTVLFARTDQAQLHWVVPEASSEALDKITGVGPGLSGDMPVICHQAVATPAIQDLYLAAGLPFTNHLMTYTSLQQATALAREQHTAGARLVGFYPPPADWGCEDALLVSTADYGWLNNKLNMPSLVDEDYLPARRLVDEQTNLAQLVSTLGLPLFAKAAIIGASGAGQDVAWCDNPQQLQDGCRALAERGHNLAGVFVEQAIEVERCWCLGLAITKQDSIYLGAALQLFDMPAQQIGSLVDAAVAPPATVIELARLIADRARQRGYLGLAGFDIAVDRQGKLYVFDLNFRVNSSTAQLLIHEAVEQAHGQCVSKSWQQHSNMPFAELVKKLQPFLRQGQLIPVRLFDAQVYEQHHPGSKAVSTVTGILLAGSVAELEQLQQRIETVLAA